MRWIMTPEQIERLIDALEAISSEIQELNSTMEQIVEAIENKNE